MEPRFGRILRDNMNEMTESIAAGAPEKVRRVKLLKCAWTGFLLLRGSASPGDADELQEQDHKGTAITQIVRERLQKAEAEGGLNDANWAQLARLAKVADDAKRQSLPDEEAPDVGAPTAASFADSARCRPSA